MKHSSLRLVLSAALVGVLCFGARADAAFMMTVTDLTNAPGSPVILTDNMAGDANPILGMIGIPLGGIMVGDFLVTNLSGVSKPFLATPFSFQTDILARVITGKLGGVLEIILTDTDFALPPPSATLVQEIGGTTDGTVDYFTEVSHGPTMLSNVGMGPGDFSGSDSASFGNPGTPFSITQTVVVTLPSNALMSFNAETLVSTPEPATLGYLGFGLGALALRRRRRGK